MYLPAALHGIEASLLASDSLPEASFLYLQCCLVPSSASGIVLVLCLSLLDGPTGCDPCFCVVWFRFRLLRRYLALWSTEVGRVYRLVRVVLGMVPIHLLSISAAEIGFRWNPDVLAWARLGLPQLSHLAGPLQHFKAAILDACRGAFAGCSWLLAAP